MRIKTIQYFATLDRFHKILPLVERRLRRREAAILDNPTQQARVLFVEANRLHERLYSRYDRFLAAR